jgi:predicted neuraminidase
MKSDCEKKDSEKSGKFGTHLHGCCVYIAGSDCAVDFEKCGHIANRPLGLLEPTAVERDDGVIVMLMRAEWGGFLWRSESRDGGKSWSQAVPTDIPNPSCLPYLIKLPDGRIALIHNPAGGIVGQRGPRSPLSVWISDDGMNSWKVKQDIVTGGKSAYPSAIIYKQRLVFVYDKDRRYVKFADIKLPNIQDEN